MAIIQRTCGLLAVALWLAAAAACGEPATPSAPFRQATADGAASPKARSASGALPSHVVTGEVTTFQVTPAGAGAPKRDAGAPLPSRLEEGRAGVYARPEGAEAAGSRPAPVPRPDR